MHACDKCPLRRLAEKKPRSFLAKLWRWHTGWCPGWKRYQAAGGDQPAGTPPSADPR